MAQSSIFPIFLRAEYSDNTGLQRFQSEAMRVAQAASGEIKKVGAALDGIFAARKNQGGAINLGVSELREAIAAQQQLAAVAREVSNATIAAAKANGSFDASLTRTADAASKNAKAQEEQLANLRAQLPLLERVQAELDKGTTALQAQLKAEQNLSNFRKTASINDGARRVISGQGAIDRAALSTATLDSVLGRTRVSNPVVAKQRNQETAEAARAAAAQAAEMEKVAAAAAKQAAAIAELARAESGAAEGAKLLQAIYRGTSLELNKTGTEFARTAKSARDSAAAFQQAFAVQAAEAEKVAAAVREQAAALAALKAQINPTAVAQEQFNQKLAFAKSALDRGELSQQEYTRAVQLASAALRQAGQAEVTAAAARNGLTAATNAGTTARGNVINSIRSERTAYIQLGQQLQDATVQAQLGTNAFIIMGQQLPQAAFALSGLADSANKTQAAIGRVATFLSGPWGAAIFVGLAVLGPFVQKLIESKEAADDSARSQRSLSEVLMDQTSSLKEVNAALDEYNRLQQKATQVTLIDIGTRAAAIASNLREALSIREKVAARIADLRAASANLRATGDRGAFGFDASANAEAVALEQNERANLATLKRLTVAANSVRAEAATEIAKVTTDSAARINAGFDLLRQGAAESIKDVRKLAERFTEIERAREAALAADRKSNRPDRSAEIAARKAAREVEQLANLGERAAEQVQRINERFDEQPRLIDQAAQANRQLNAIVADINKELATSKNLTKAQHEEFDRIKVAAAAAGETIGNALLRPFQDLRRESDQRLQIERLISQGRYDEAAGLQEVFRIEEQLGREVDLRAQVQKLIAAGQKEEAARLNAFIDGYADLKDEAAARVASEQRTTRELRAQAELLELQADVARTMADSLRDVFSGRGTVKDLFKNLQQSIRDLQGARLFESLFGPAFRQLEEELRGNTPQGRANARATKEIETFASNGRAAADAVMRFADAVNGATDQIMRGPLAANDNGLGVDADGGITVIGKRPVEESPTEIATRSTKEIADRIAKATVEGFMGPLKDVLGTGFTENLSAVLTSALSGFIRGGKVGGILGGLQGITSVIDGLGGVSKKLGELIKGAETGQAVNAIGNALGIKGSKTGAQLGGVGGQALGTIIGGPVGGKIGQVVGAIAGNLIGGLLKSAKRGSATIGGVGGSLGITGTVGNSAALRDTANTLAGSVLESVNNIARQLGATVDASRGSVSIGQRKDNLRVDPSGRGATKIGNGAIDFGDDTEAAVAFAVQNLIQDGVITGLRASETRLLQAGKDVNAAIQDVLTFRGVFDRLKAIKDPVGAAIDGINREFEGFIEVFNRAGASAEEFASLEELYGLERAKAIKDASDQFVGSLRQLLNDLKIGDNGLSLRDRQANALTQFNGLASRVAAGDTAAFDEFADISQQLLDIERQLFGSTQSYFDRLAQVTTLTERAIADQTNVASISSARPSPFNDAPLIDRSIDTMSSNLGGKLDQLNANIVAGFNGLAQVGFTSGGSYFDNGITASRIANF